MSQAQKKPLMAPKMEPVPIQSSSEPKAEKADVPPKANSHGEHDYKVPAMEFFRIRKAELNLQEIHSPQIHPRTEIFQKLCQSALPSRLGIIGRCALSEHDVHLIDEQQNIMQHFREGESVPAGFEAARGLVLEMPEKFVGIVVYTNKTEALLTNGSTVPYP